MVNCCVKDCSSNTQRDVKTNFFRIPIAIKNQDDMIYDISSERRRLWLERINRKSLTEEDDTSRTRVCSLHFISGKLELLALIH